MEVLNGRSVININIKCVILMYMGDNWILNYPSIKHIIHYAGSFFMKIIISKRSVVLPCNSKIHIYMYFGNIPSFYFPSQDFAIEFLQQGLTTKPTPCELLLDYED